MNDHIRKRFAGRWCIYCGELAQTDEHFPPQAHGNEGWILPACSECNSVAGTEWPEDFIARCKYVKNQLSRRYPEYPLPEESMNKILNQDDEQWEQTLNILAYERRRRKRLAWDVNVYLTLINGGKPFLKEIKSTNKMHRKAICESCEKEYSQRRSHSRHCSQRCADNHRYFNTARTCQTCKTEFKPKELNQYCCTDACWNKFRIQHGAVQ